MTRPQSRSNSPTIGAHFKTAGAGRRLLRWLVEWPDQLAKFTTAKQRRAIHFWLTACWLTAGTVIWLFLRSALWFVGLMSLYAIWISHLAGWSAETPAEVEELPPTDG